MVAPYVTIVTYLLRRTLAIIPLIMKEHAETEIVSKVIDDIVKRRKELGLSHQRLAEGAHLNRSAISLIESKKRTPSLLTVLKICGVLDLSLADILKKHEL